MPVYALTSATANALAREDASQTLRNDAMAHARSIGGPTRSTTAKYIATGLLIDALVGISGPSEFSRILLFLKEHATNWNADDVAEVDLWGEIENAARKMRQEADERLRDTHRDSSYDEDTA